MNESKTNPGRLDGDDETPLNFAMMYYVGLNKRIDFKDQAYINNDLESWYKELNRIYTRVCIKIKEKSSDDDEFIKLFTRARNLIKSDPMSYEISFILHKIDVKLMRLMHRNGMIFPKITKAWGIDKIKQRYNLGEIKK